MRNVSRRAALRGLGALAAGTALAACTVTTSGNVTTITLNVAKITAYGQAGVNAAATIISLASGISALTPYLAAIEAAETALATALTAFSAAAGSSVTVSYDDTNWKTRVDSLLSDIESVSSTIAAAISGAGSSLSSTVKSDATTAANALATVVSLFEALLGSTSAARLGMTEAQALKALGVSR
ncbi:hypothetical protein [Acetobacter sp. DsW_063]|uniref:hypothetical protein n=1 Tax=Acetobacter sp. DsW_063 TaxID=1514894 RepID=UPI000A3960AF|nr:hypothetical protein [Acetobacter sp. DsW_063]OUJ16475.1 hypothetical protein HK28_12405 [Acetobacter sp. DsW_063]